MPSAASRSSGAELAAPRRLQARTQLARRAVLDAARHLFLDGGYGTTTIEAISATSGVPAPTVYRLFASKHGILKALLDVSITGDDDPTPVAQRPEVQALLRHSDPARQLAGLAAISVDINGRVGPLYRVLSSAADSDADAMALLNTLTAQRQAGQGGFAESLARSKALRPGMSASDAADIIHALASPELYWLLVIDRDWSVPRYERWLAESLCQQLLP